MNLTRNELAQFEYKNPSAHYFVSNSQRLGIVKNIKIVSVDDIVRSFAIEMDWSIEFKEQRFKDMVWTPIRASLQLTHKVRFDQPNGLIYKDNWVIVLGRKGPMLRFTLDPHEIDFAYQLREEYNELMMHH